MMPWSYSHLDKFETCPFQFYKVKVERSVTEPLTIHTKWGKEVHDAFEGRILFGNPLPEGMTQWEPIATKLEFLPGTKLTEFPIALDRNFVPTKWDQCWTRGIIDLLVVADSTAAVIDYKTGKPKPSEQLRLYAGYTFALYPHINTVHTGYVWLKHKRIDKETIKRTDMPDVWQQLLERVARLEHAFATNRWPPRPSGLCRGWCPVQDCAFWTSK